MKKKQLIISQEDRERLDALIERARTDNSRLETADARVREEYLSALEAELGRARVVPPEKMPPDVVTMNSIVRLRDLDSDETEEYELVYPSKADLELNRISVLAPIGTAILGYRVGDVIEWKVPAGMRRLRVEDVLFQPERAGTVPQ